jgi:hypothetical protein
MKIYDILVIGNDVSAFYAAAFLSQKGYEVAHVFPDQPELKRTLNKNETVTFDPMFFGRLGVSQKILEQAQLGAFIQDDVKAYVEILSDGRVLTRSNEKANLRRYLLRHFPQEHQAIDQWFKDRHKEYKEWAKALDLFIETGESIYMESLEGYQSQTLQSLLDASFQNPALKQSIQVMSHFDGYRLNQIKAIDYIMHWFLIIEEGGRPFSYDAEALIKHFKKQSPSVDYLKSPLKTIQFETDRYVINLKNKETLTARFLFGQTTRHDDDLIIYRNIDVVCDPSFYQKHFSEEIVFNETPLFDFLRVIPLHLYQPKLKHHLRIEAVSEANKDLILTFIDRYFKGFEASVTSAVEYPPVRKRLRDIEDALSETQNPESDLALWAEPKWLQIDFNYQPNSLFSKRLLKTRYYLNSIVRALEKETHPPVTSPLVKAFEKWVLRFEPGSPVDLTVQSGFQKVHLSATREGALISQNLNPTIYDIKAAEMIRVSEEGFSEESIEALMLENEPKELLKTAFIRQKKVLPSPIGFLQLNLMLILLISLTLFPFNASFTFSAAAIFGFMGILRWLIYKEWTFFEFGLTVMLALVSFVQLTETVNIGFFFAVLAVLGWILQFMPMGWFRHFFMHDPIRNHYSMYYMKKFSQRMTRYISVSFLIMSLGAGADTLGVSIIAAMLVLALSFLGYMRPLIPSVRKHI